MIQASGKPALFHVGFTVLGANTDGGSGIALDYGRPIHLDMLARDFPKMKIIAAHPGWPWEQELIGVVTHKKNLFVDTSGYLAEQLPEVFLKAVALARNTGVALDGLTTVNIDFMRMYRPQTNVVSRPVAGTNGTGISLIGHHEILIPLIAAAVIARG